MARWALVVPLLAKLSLAAEDSLALLQVRSRGWRAPASSAGEVRHHWAAKNGDQNRSGSSAHVAPFDLSTPTWTYTLPVPFHNSPVIDSEGNVYAAHAQLGVVALDGRGNERWRHKLLWPGNPVLLGNQIFVCSADGVVHSISLATGSERWQSKVAKNCPSDAWSAAGSGQTVIVMANVDSNSTDGNCDILAVNATDGSQIWRLPLCQKGLATGYNGMPSIVGNAVLFQDKQGGMHRLSLASGAIEWSKPPYKKDSGAMSTGGLATGPNGVVYGASNYEGHCDKGKGILQAVDLQTGAARWQRLFDHGLNSGPAVGRLGPSGRLAVIAQVSDNFLEFGVMGSFWLAGHAGPGPVHNGTVLAIDAETGETMWSFDVDGYTSWVYPEQAQGCLPDAFGNPAIGGDGTVYVNWSGGYAYAIRDADGDGTISPQEVSKVHTSSGMNGETAIAPGLAVVPSCDALRGYIA
uniref:EF-hand domain-containing protein n=1 Tax=Alexandrium catenella TaxID=2925 RepID=A0A7S1LEE5_ALECA|mmetsp:Transcript_111835/g.297242  ORF Transcript_111835/g.297242 Transcript_111835/m.297242 type:complete len:465 (+) Transcript_111835:83-1477(+)